MKIKKGISLIVLIITIIVVVIIAGSVILNLTDTNVIDEAGKAVFANDLSNFQTELELYKLNKSLENRGNYSSGLLSANTESVTYNGSVVSGETIYDIIPSLEGMTKYEGVVEVVNGELMYIGDDLILKEVANSVGASTYTAFSSDGLVDSGINYTETTSSFNNPERGFYTMQTLILSNPYSIEEVNDKLEDSVYCSTVCNDNGLNIVLFKICLENYKNENIPNGWLEGLNEIADFYRKRGIKLIIRCTYGEDADTYTDPSNFEQIITHIDQLEDFFVTNEDIIYVVEAGFLGPWGEWHSTIYDDSTYRTRIINKLLEVLPESRKINLRTPDFYRMRFGDSAFDESKGYTTLDEARVGYHNDAFLSNSTDKGTYAVGERENELNWLSTLTKYTIFGGESTMDSEEVIEYNDTDDAISEMTTLHAQYFNYDYDPDTMTKWKGLYDNTDSVYSGLSTYKLVNDRLGYRFVLYNSKIPTNVKAGENLNISVDIDNTGFGNLVNYREAYMLLEKDQQYYKAKIDTEVRRWFAGETTKLEMVFQVPGNIDLGQWKAYIQLPDYDENLTHEDFFVKFANDNIWNQYVKANYIGTVEVTSGSVSNNNKFYQINTNNVTIEDENLLSYNIPKVVDGNNTANEWNESNKIYSQSGYDIYMDNDNEYLYMYIDTDLSLYNYIALYFDNASYTEGNKFENKYKFLIEQSWGGYLYTGAGGSDWNWSEELLSVNYILSTSSGYEYKIPLTYLQVYDSEAVLQNIWVNHHLSAGGKFNVTGGDSITYTIK